MSFDQSQFATVGAHSANTPNLYAYRTSDSLTTVLTADYFLGKRFQLETGDIIMAIITGAFVFLEVTAASASTVTTKTTIVTFAPDSTDNVVPRFDGTAGKLQGSVILANDDGSVRIGDGTNNTTIETTGVVRADGTARTWKDINLGGSTLGGPLGLRPDIVQIVDNLGANTGIYTLGVAPTEAVSGVFEIQHDYAEGTDLYFHIHLLGIAAPTGTDKIKFQLDYAFSEVGETFPPVTSIVKEIDFDTQYEAARIDFDAIDGTGHIIGEQLNFTITRIAASADEYAGDALLETVGVHYQVDTAGSRSIGAK